MYNTVIYQTQLCMWFARLHAAHTHAINQLAHCVRRAFKKDTTTMTEQQYRALFNRFAMYRLPDGTEAQAIWTGDEPTDRNRTWGGAPYWALIPQNERPQTYQQRPCDQYNIYADGRVTELHWAEFGSDNLPIERLTDLTLDDISKVTP
jgi:hypothetical protein